MLSDVTERLGTEDFARSVGYESIPRNLPTRLCGPHDYITENSLEWLQIIFTVTLCVGRCYILSQTLQVTTSLTASLSSKK